VPEEINVPGVDTSPGKFQDRNRSFQRFKTQAVCITFFLQARQEYGHEVKHSS
jgi:hypothetical protein